jgi:glucosyl-dolichyl phosphate glucuronosyltransferase
MRNVAIELSVIIPTRNRAAYLRDAVRSALDQALAPDRYEVIVVDNGSTDDTEQVLDELGRSAPGRLRCLADDRPGLHVGRHLGAKEARSELLVYADDDIVADPGWLEAIAGAFDDEDTVLVGGPILPKWEGEVPDWLDRFKTCVEGGWYLGSLSLLDLGGDRRQIEPTLVFGCNFSIRRQVLYDCAGFHPDAVPPDMIRYRGDGETGLATVIRQRGLRTVYEPAALVWHRVPPERLTVEYFYRRSFNQGVSNSFAEIRRHGGLPPRPWPSWRSRLRRIAGRVLRASRTHPVVAQVADAEWQGRQYHRREVARDPDLLRYVLQESYDEP